MLTYADTLLGDFLMAENSPPGSPFASPKLNQPNLNYNGDTPSLDDGPETPSFGGPGYVICFSFLEAKHF